MFSNQVKNNKKKQLSVSWSNKTTFETEKVVQKNYLRSEKREGR